MKTIDKIDKLIEQEIKEIYDTMAYHGDKHTLAMQPYLHTMDKIINLVQGLSDGIASDLNSGAVDVIVLKRTIFDLMDDLIRAVSYEKAKLERQLIDARDDED